LVSLKTKQQQHHCLEEMDTAKKKRRKSKVEQRSESIWEEAFERARLVDLEGRVLAGSVVVSHSTEFEVLADFVRIQLSRLSGHDEISESIPEDCSDGSIAEYKEMAMVETKPSVSELDMSEGTAESSLLKQICRAWLKNTYLGIGAACSTAVCSRKHSLAGMSTGQLYSDFSFKGLSKDQRKRIISRASSDALGVCTSDMETCASGEKMEAGETFMNSRRKKSKPRDVEAKSHEAKEFETIDMVDQKELSEETELVVEREKKKRSRHPSKHTLPLDVIAHAGGDESPTVDADEESVLVEDKGCHMPPPKKSKKHKYHKAVKSIR
jgi:hypothetical protein